MTHSAPPSTARSTLVAFRWPLVLIALMVLAYLLWRDTFSRVDRAAGAVSNVAAAAARGAEELAGKFWSGDVTESFVAAIPEVQSAGGGRLEVATARVTETLTRSDERRILWDAISLGTTVSEIKVPVTYRYHLPLEGPWRIEIQQGTCIVYAPAIRPSLPPAIHSDGIEKRVAAGWLRFDGADQLADLERSLTPRLVGLASDPRHLAFAREPARHTVAEFVRTWLLQQEQWGGDAASTLLVVFPDEATHAAEAPKLVPDPN